MPVKVLTIGGSDPYAGGGIQADLATYHAYQVFGMSVLTSIVTNVDQRFSIKALDDQLFQAQLASLNEVQFDAIKIGLLVSKAQVQSVRAFLAHHVEAHVVLDPVFALKETDERSNESLSAYLMEQLSPFSTVCTPNVAEAVTLVNSPFPQTQHALSKLATHLVEQYDTSFYVKGGLRFSQEEAIDYLATKHELIKFSETIQVKQIVNGSGCTFASAIAANLAVGHSLEKAVHNAKQFVTTSILNQVFVTPQFASIWPKGGNLE
ncbi:hydroxymethylpyrimidine/phosphomethylpyrimidine kinase [Enterococcus bulliens]